MSDIKIKSRPEDFVVRETACLDVVSKGPYGMYVLVKKAWNTTDLLKAMARNLKLPAKHFSYGGRKDKHAWTRQYITIQGPRVPDMSGKDFSLEFLGFMLRPMGPDLMTGNEFEIIVRDLIPEKAVMAFEEIPYLKQFGFPNYFDDQRFGSYADEQGFIGEKILTGHNSGALKIYSTAVGTEDRKQDRDRKKFFYDHWKDWKACLQAAQTPFEKKAFSWLAKYPSKFLPLLREIPREELSLFFSSFQSFLWNESVRRLLKKLLGPALKTYPGRVGDYVFYRELAHPFREYWENLSLPTPGSKTRMPDDQTAHIYSEILEERGIETSMFNKLKTRQAFFKTFDRRAAVQPVSLSAEILSDSLYSGKKALKLAFSLPRGSFGTMLIKRLFSS